MSSVWIRKRPTSRGENRYRVEFRPAGRGSRIGYAGTFRRREDALTRMHWVSGELAARRRPDLRSLDREGERVPTVIDAAEAWLASRVDVADSTRARHRSELERIRPLIGSRRVDEITPADVAGFVVELANRGYSRGTVKKTLEAVRMTLDHAGINNPNPARDRQVRLPREEQVEINPPTADHLEAVYRLLPSKHRLPFLWLDWSGARVASVDLTLVGDYDEPRRRIRLRAATTKTRKAVWVELHPVLADAVEEQLGPRDDRDLEARLFVDSGADALRTAIAKACKAAGVPLVSPHYLRHRRISLLHLRGVPWAVIGQQIGQRDLAVTANTYSHVLADERELEYAELLQP
jgi:integrase